MCASLQVVQVTCLVKYSNSSVDVLSCFTKVRLLAQLMQLHFCREIVLEKSAFYAKRLVNLLYSVSYCHRHSFVLKARKYIYDLKTQACVS